MEPTEGSFEKLEVWRRSQAISIELYRLLAECRDWGFKDQITRAANSIADNIAEGAERRGKAEFKQFLSFAKGSAGETRSQVLRAIALGYITQDRGSAMVVELREISRMIHGLIKSLDRLCPNLNLIFPLQLAMPARESSSPAAPARASTR